MSFLSIKEAFHNLLSHTRGNGRTAEFGRDARTDWQVVFSVFIVLNILTIGLSVYIYEKIDKGGIFLVDKKSSAAADTLNRFELERTISYFEAKQERFDALLRKELPTKDPYLPIAPLKK